MLNTITEKDLLNIGLSKNYVKSIFTRVSEYNEKHLNGIILWQTSLHPPIQEHEMTWGKEYEEEE